MQSMPLPVAYTLQTWAVRMRTPTPNEWEWLERQRIHWQCTILLLVVLQTLGGCRGDGHSSGRTFSTANASDL